MDSENLTSLIRLSVSDGQKTDSSKVVSFKGISNTPHLYSQWLNSVIYWLINHCTDSAQTGVTSFGRQFDFHDIIFTYGIVTLTIEGIRSFLQLFYIQIIRKDASFSLNKSCRKF